MEWQGSAVQAIDNYHHIRCISPGLGSSLQWYQNRGPMEPLGAGNAHKLPRVTGSNSSSKDLSEGSDRAVSTVTAGQSNSCSLHQQHGRYSVPPTDRSSQSPLDVGLIQQHSSDCRVHSRSSESCSRYRVQVHDGHDRLEASSQVAPRDQPEVGIPRGEPVCISPVHTTTSLLQLETRPNSRGDRCVHPAMGEVQRLCKPPMVPDRKSPVASAATTSPSNLSGSGMEGPALVSNSAGNAVRLSTTTSSHTEPVSADIQCESNGSPAPTGRLACLREKFRCRGLSEAAKELLLASWRSKTFRAYDSHIRKWLGWCTERGRDPVSGPISDVVANLHTQGYQTNSLSAYRSAISTVHDRVDDVDVGKHPLVARVLKRAYHARPSLPRYTTTRNVQVVLEMVS